MIAASPVHFSPFKETTLTYPKPTHQYLPLFLSILKTTSLQNSSFPNGYTVRLTWPQLPFHCNQVRLIPYPKIGLNLPIDTFPQPKLTPRGHLQLSNPP